MKKTITMVGTSLFENYTKVNSGDKTFKNYLEDLKDKRLNEYENNKDRIKYIKKKILDCLYNNRNASAEIKSLIKLKQELNEDFEIYLLVSDTVLSKLAGEILNENLTQFDVLSSSRISLKEIKNLQIWERDSFIKGMVSLINAIYSIAREYWDNVIINITGGYKATVPYLTILGQVNKCDIYYIFEETDALIKIPYVPLSINWEIFEQNEIFFMKLEREEVIKISSETQFKNEIEALIEKADNFISLNPLGVTLWKTYKQRFDIFYISNLVEEYLEKKDKKYKQISHKSFTELKRRLKENPDHPDLDHQIVGIKLSEGFKCFKHKEENLQVRILYKVQKRKTTYGTKEIDIYIGLIAIGNEVHNAGNNSEYVEKFDKKIDQIKNTQSYESYRIEK